MDNPAVMLNAVPELMSMSAAIHQTGMAEETLELVHLRVSQLNQCSFCVDMAGTALLKLGVIPERIIAVAAWQESEFFDYAERAALKAAEEAAQLGGSVGLTDRTWTELKNHYPEQQIAALLLHVGIVGLWNTLNHAVKQTPGAW